VLPKLVIADTERKGREKCFEKLTGKLTESLTMQEKLVKENAQLEGGKYARLLYNINLYKQQQIYINRFIFYMMIKSTHKNNLQGKSNYILNIGDLKIAQNVKIIKI